MTGTALKKVDIVGRFGGVLGLFFCNRLPCLSRYRYYDIRDLDQGLILARYMGAQAGLLWKI